MLKRAFLLMLWLGAISTLSGCQAGRYYPPPKLPAEMLIGAEKENSLAEVGARAKEVLSWRGLSRTFWRQQERELRLRHAIVFSGPQRVRVETLPPTGAFALSLLLVNGPQVLFLDAERKTAVRSDNAGRLLEEALGIKLSAAELTAYLTGRVPASASGAEELFRDEFGQEVLLQRGLHTYFSLDPPTYTLKRAHVRTPSGDRLLYEIECSAYKNINGVPMPSQVTIWIPRKEMRIALNFSSLTVNTPISEGLFSAPVPADYKLEMY